jgi:hypothetical protein
MLTRGVGDNVSEERLLRCVDAVRLTRREKSELRAINRARKLPRP